MKKFIFLSVLTLSVATTNAQLELIGTLPKDISLLGAYTMYMTTSVPNIQYFYSSDTTSTTIVCHFFSAKTLLETKTVTIPRLVPASSGQSWGHLIQLAYINFWANDNLLYFIDRQGSERNQQSILFNEYGREIQRFDDGYPTIFPTQDGYLLFERKEESYNVYSIPGNGVPSDLEFPTTPVRQSNVQKFIEDGQMYIILDGIKYAVTGSTTL